MISFLAASLTVPVLSRAFLSIIIIVIINIIINNDNKAEDNDKKEGRTTADD